MDPERWHQIERIYHAVLEREPRERAAVLSEACQHDDDLRREVESLLDQHASLTGTLDRCAADLLNDSSSPQLRRGSQVGPYRIDCILGQGGMGSVYRALDTKLKRPVAIKFLSDELADVAARRRFQREAEMASALNHPHILHVYETGELAGRQYLVTEFVDGGTLRDWARSEQRTWRQVVEILTGVADGLACGHEAAILHRDIKPENVLVAKNGYAKLADFGLAKLLEGPDNDITRTLTANRTGPGVIMGTIPYMSPEQASGKQVDARSDLFSFAVLLYEMLAGHRPFRGATDLEVLQRIIHARPEPLGETIPASLRGLVEKALEKEPAERYQSMRELVVDMRRLSRQTEEVPPPKPPRPWSWAAAAVLIALSAWGGSALWFRSRNPAASPRLEYTQLTNFADSAVSPALSPDGKMLSFVRGENTFVGPGEIYLKLLPDGEPVQLTHDGLPKTGPPLFSPDGSRLAFAIQNHNTWTVPVLGGEPTQMLTNAVGLAWYDAAPGQRRILFSTLTGEGIHMTLVTSTESRSGERTVYAPADVNGMAHRSYLSPDHKWLLAVEMDIGGWLPCRLVPFDGSSLGKPVGPAPAQCTDAGWSPDGKWMFMSSNTGSGFHIWRQRFPDGVPEQVTAGATEEQGVSFAPDGRSFVTSVGETQSTLWLHDARSDTQLTSEGYAYLPSFSADGKKLYYLLRSRANRKFVSGELWARDLGTGRHERLLPDFLMEHYNVSPDGQRVVFLMLDDAGRAPVWIAPLDRSSPPRRLAAIDSTRALFGENGDIFFTGGEGGTKFLYRIHPDGSGLRKVLTNSVSFIYSTSPDGKWLVTWEAFAVVIRSTDGSSRTVICEHCATAGEENRGVTPPLMSWSPDQKFLYMHLAEAGRVTYAIRLLAGQPYLSFPTSKIGTHKDLADFLDKWPGARAIPQQRAFIGANPSIYVYPRVTAHRNIYRIPVH